MLNFIKAMEFINESMQKVGNWSYPEFVAAVCMLIEEYCLKHGLSAKEVMRNMADTAELVEDECGVYRKEVIA